MIEPKVLGQFSRVKILDPVWLTMFLLIYFLLKGVLGKHPLSLVIQFLF